MNTIDVGNLIESVGENLIKQISIFGFLSDTWGDYQKKKLSHFLNDVKDGLKEICIDDVTKNDILHNFYLTLYAIDKARKQERIKIYSELYCSYLKNPTLNTQSHDNYELVLNLLTNLTEIELNLLLLLNRHEMPFRVEVKDRPNQAVSSSQYWEVFLIEAHQNMNLDIKLVNNLLTILEAKGMFGRSQNHGFYTNQNGFGVLTPIFKNILTYLPSIK